MSEKKYCLHINEEQAKMIEMALEDWFRVRMGQFYDLADDLAQICDQHRNDESGKREKFYDYIARRNAIEELLKGAWTIATKNQLATTSSKLTNVQDIWKVVRHTLWVNRPDYEKLDKWCTANDTPRQYGDYPLPVMEVEETEAKQ